MAGIKGGDLPPWGAGLAVLAIVVLGLVFSGPGAAPEKEKAAAVAIPADSFPSTYEPLPSRTTVIRNATVLTGTGAQIDDASVLMKDGKIAAVGADIEVPDDAVVIDGEGKFVTPGIIDAHSHLGVYPSPGAAAHSDGNEAIKPVTAEVWAEHSAWPQDPGFARAIAGGVTTLQLLPGSANLIGGRSAIVRNVSSRTVQGMKFPGAGHGLKMACGENPKRVYGQKGGPSTRMGNVAGYRAAFSKAQAYKRKWEKYAADVEKGKEAEPPERDLQLDTLALAIDRKIWIHNHCYRADEMAIMIDVSKEFGYKIAAFHHASEAYKVADLLKANDICAAMWADWWGFKLESYDGIPENIAMVDAAGACAMIHSDSEVGVQRLNQEVGKAMADGRRMGLDIPPARAVAWMTSNPAKALGILDQTGTLEPGKRADVVVWSRDPFSVYAQAEQVYLDGALVYDRDDGALSPRTDFELGQVPGRTNTGGAGQ